MPPKKGRRSKKRVSKETSRRSHRRSRRTRTRSYRGIPRRIRQLFKSKESHTNTLTYDPAQRLTTHPFNLTDIKADIIRLQEDIEDQHLNIFARACEQGLLENCKYLDLSVNKITAGGIKHLAGVMKFLPNLDTLKLGHNQIRGAGCTALVEAINALSKLKELNLDENEIGDEGMESFRNLTTAPPRFQPRILSLKSNNIGNEGMTALADAAACTVLWKCEKLDLADNVFNDDGLQALVSQIYYLPNLTELSLALNFEIGNNGIEALYDALVANKLPKLQLLRLNDQPYTMLPALKTACTQRNIELHLEET